MKKPYTTPRIEFITINIAHIIAASNIPTTLKDGGSNEFAGPTVAESQGFVGGLIEEEDDDYTE